MRAGPGRRPGPNELLAARSWPGALPPRSRAAKAACSVLVRDQ